MNDIVIVAAQRTAVGKFGGSLSKISAATLGSYVIHGLLNQTRIDPGSVDEVVMGQVLTAGCGQNPSRQAMMNAGLPNTVSAMTVNMVCGSGLLAVHLATQAIKSGDAKIVIAGGQENMSASPHVLNNSRDGIRMGDGKLVDTMMFDGLWDVYNQYPMGMTAENVAEKFNISRQEQDEFAVESQNKAEIAQKSGKFKDEILPISIQQKNSLAIFDRDEYIKEGSSVARISELRPVFKKGGTVTAANSSGVNDGAAAVMLMSASTAEQLGLSPIARIKAFASAGVDPALMGMGPVPAAQRCLKKAGWSYQDLDLMEINEAFAAQAIAVNREMGWDTKKINVNGGAIAIGHPIGASGCRILVTLLHEMVRRDARRGLASLCVGGGMGVAMAIER